MKLVINQCFGGFDLSKEAQDRYRELAGSLPKCFGTIPRNDKYLVQVVEELGEKANEWYSDLKVVEIPKGTLYRIEYYDGLETIKLKDSDEGWMLATD